MRGKPIQLSGIEVVTRITPAHAGKTDNVIFRVREDADHPRACGENPYAKKVFDCSGGSPPRMRGKQLVNFP